MPRLLVVLLALGLSAAFAAPASAATTVDFESPAVSDGTAVTNQFAATKGVTFVSGAPTGAQGIPVMHVSGADAHGGTHALNVSTDTQEFPHPDFAGAFSTTRSTVSLWARSVDANASVTLDAYAAGAATPTATVSHALTGGGGWVQFTVTSPGAAATLAYFRLHSPASTTVLVDDLTYDDPVAPPPADFAIETGTPSFSLAAGIAKDVPLTINRINGSSGPITLSLSPSSVYATATFSPNPVPAGVTSVTMTVTPKDMPGSIGVDVVGTPRDAAVGPGPRVASLTIDVQYAVRVSPLLDPGPPTLPPCTSAVRRFQFQRGAGMTAPIDVTPQAVPRFVTATLDPATIPVDGRTTDLTITRGDDNTASARAFVAVHATGQTTTLANETDQVFNLVDPTITSVTSRSGDSIGAAPSGLRAGDLVTFTGSGFCPGSVAQFGTATATSPLTIAPGGTQAIATVPRNAESGMLTIVSPAGRIIPAPNPFTVTTYRGTNGFPFQNFDYSGSIDNWVNLYGFDQFLLSVDPCSWAGGHCPIPTGLPNLASLIVFAAADPTLVNGHGSCFGFALASRRIASGQGPSPASFGGRSTVFSIPNGGAIDHYIWAQHTAQYSSEFLAQWWKQSAGGALAARSATELYNQISQAVNQGHAPLISLRQDMHGHAINAYDLTDRTPDGGFTIRVYNNNIPFVAAENDPDGARFATNDNFSKIVVDGAGHWTFPELGWSGGLDHITAVDETTIPVRPTLPSSPDGLAIFVFGAGAPSASATQAIAGAARESVARREQTVDQGTRLAEYVLPDTPNPAPILLAQTGAAHTVPVTPGAGGAVKTMIAGGGKSAQVTASGLTGASAVSSGATAGDLGLTFAKASAVSLDVAGAPAKDLTASMTAAFSGKLTGGVAVASHGGTYALTAHGKGVLRLSLAAAGDPKGPAAFQGAAIPISGASTVSLKPDWRHAGAALRVRVTAGGRTRTVTVKNTARPAAPVGRVTVKPTRASAQVTVAVKAKIGGKASSAVGSVGVTIKRGSKVIATKGIAASGAALKSSTLSLTLPAGAKGPFTVNAAVTTVGAGTTPSASSTGRAKARLK